MNDGGAAFPYQGDQFKNTEVGMTLRDYFAAKVLSELTRQCDDVPKKTIEMAMLRAGVGNAYALVAKRSYEIADAMLTERAKS